MDRGIIFQNVSKVFKGKDSYVVALNDVSFTVEDGAFVSVVGPSGCGKSTLLRIAAGLIKPTSGRVFLNGKEVNHPQTNIGIVFQFPTLLPWRTTIGNILFQVEMRGLNKNGYIDRCRKLIKMVGLEGFENKYPSQLSGGMQMRVALCRALIHDPPILLMDEPFRGLDAITQDALDYELMRLWEITRKTVLFITHNLMEAVFLSDKVVVLSPRPGKVVSIVNIEIERPRKPSIKQNSDFVSYVVTLRDMIEEGIGYGAKQEYD
ncbi:MAG: ABC transporter ATP-binding protein [Candidatus Caldarchaeum sp.]